MEYPIEPAAEREHSLKNYTLAVYALYAVSLVFGITGVVGLIIAYIKRGEAAGTFYADHLNYLIRTFWWALAAGVVGMLTLFIGVGVLVLLAVTVWFIYRVVAGFIRFNDGKPVSKNSQG